MKDDLNKDDEVELNYVSYDEESKNLTENPAPNSLEAPLEASTQAQLPAPSILDKIKFYCKKTLSFFGLWHGEVYYNYNEEIYYKDKAEKQNYLEFQKGIIISEEEYDQKKSKSNTESNNLIKEEEGLELDYVSEEELTENDPKQKEEISDENKKDTNKPFVVGR